MAPLNRRVLNEPNGGSGLNVSRDLPRPAEGFLHAGSAVVSAGHRSMLGIIAYQSHAQLFILNGH